MRADRVGRDPPARLTPGTLVGAASGRTPRSSPGPFRHRSRRRCSHRRRSVPTAEIALATFSGCRPPAKSTSVPHGDLPGNCQFAIGSRSRHGHALSWRRPRPDPGERLTLSPHIPHKPGAIESMVVSVIRHYDEDRRSLDPSTLRLNDVRADGAGPGQARPSSAIRLISSADCSTKTPTDCRRRRPKGGEPAP